MTNEYQLKSGTSALTAFRAMARALLLTACAIVCITAGLAPAVYGTGIPDIEDLQPGMLRFHSIGPVQIEVTDPEGNSVGRDANQIDGAAFFDGDREVVIDIPHPIIGEYEVHVNVSGSANRLQHFGVLVTNGTDTIQLADNLLIVNIPDEPYVIQNSVDGFAIAVDAVDDSSGTSMNLVWILVGVAGILVGAVVLIVRSRKRTQ